MAVDKKISQLASGAPAQAGDEYVVARSGANYKLTLTNIAASMPPIGATTPNTGAFTTLSASSTVSGTGFTNYFASPPAIGGTAANTGAFTSLSASSGATISGGNLAFTTTAQRITGDMNNATVTNRLAFQNSVSNANSFLEILPNGTGTSAGLILEGDSAAANGTTFQFTTGAQSNTEARIAAGIRGTGSYLPITILTGGSERVRIDTSGNMGLGTASPVGRLTSDLTTGSTVTNTLTLNNGGGGAGSGAALNFYASNASQPFTGRINSLDDGNYGYHLVFSNKPPGSVGAGALTERMRIDSSGNVGIGTTTIGGGGTDTRLQVANANISSFGPHANLMVTTTDAQAANVGGIIGLGGSVTTATPTSNMRLFAAIRGAKDDSNDGYTNGYMAFYTMPLFSTTPVERMRIDSSGNVGIGGTAQALDKVSIAGALPSSGSASLGVIVRSTVPSASTAVGIGFTSALSTAAASFTCGQLDHFRADPSAFGAGSTVTTQIGFNVTSALTGATNNYGFYSNIASGSNRWNFYAAGTAQNYFAGNVGIGVAPTVELDVKNGGGNCTISAQYGTGTKGQLIAANNEVQLKAFNGTNDVLTFATGSTERMRIGSDGNVGIGAASLSNVRLSIKTVDATSSNYAISAQNTTPNDLFWIRNDGAFYVGNGAANSPYNLTTGDAANAVIGADGILRRSTSSLRYKTDVAGAFHGLADVLKLRSVTYKTKTDGDRVFGGLIAEEVHDAGLTEFVAYDKEGRPDAIHYGNMVALLVKAVQELTARVAELEAK